MKNSPSSAVLLCAMVAACAVQPKSIELAQVPIRKPATKLTPADEERCDWGFECNDVHVQHTAPDDFPAKSPIEALRITFGELLDPALTGKTRLELAMLTGHDPEYDAEGGFNPKQEFDLLERIGNRGPDACRFVRGSILDLLSDFDVEETAEAIAVDFPGETTGRNKKTWDKAVAKAKTDIESARAFAYAFNCDQLTSDKR